MKRFFTAFFLLLSLSVASQNVKIIKNNGLYGFKYKFRTVQPRFSVLGEFTESRAKVNYKGLWGYINTKGKEVIPITYTYLSDVDENKSIIATYKGEKGILDYNGKVILAFDKYESISLVGDSYHCTLLDLKKNSKNTYVYDKHLTLQNTIKENIANKQNPKSKTDIKFTLDKTKNKNKKNINIKLDKEENIDVDTKIKNLESFLDVMKKASDPTKIRGLIKQSFQDSTMLKLGGAFKNIPLEQMTTGPFIDKIVTTLEKIDFKKYEKDIYKTSLKLEKIKSIKVKSEREQAMNKLEKELAENSFITEITVEVQPLLEELMTYMFSLLEGVFEGIMD